MNIEVDADEENLILMALKWNVADMPAAKSCRFSSLVSDRSPVLYHRMTSPPWTGMKLTSIVIGMEISDRQIRAL